MNKEFYKEYIKPFVVLCVICLAVSALLGVTNMVTAPIIEANNNAAAIATRMELLPEATTFKHIPTDFPGVTSFYMDEGGSGSVIVAAFKGYGGLVPVTVAIAPDGSILDLRVDVSTETTGLGTKAGEDAYLRNFIGKTYADFADLIAGLSDAAAAPDTASEATGDTTSEATGDTTAEATGDTTSEATGHTDTTAEATEDTTSEATGHTDTTAEATGDTTSEATGHTDTTAEATGDTTSEATGEADTGSSATGEVSVPTDGAIDTISGATYSSKAVLNGIAAAMGAYNQYMGGVK